MSLYLLDTNACIRILNNSSDSLVRRLCEKQPELIHLSSIVKAELLYGARHSACVGENLVLLNRFFAPFPSVSFDDRCAEQYGVIRAELAGLGTPIGPNDLMIAATARAHDLILVTHNTGEFHRVTGLQVEDWEQNATRPG